MIKRSGMRELNHNLYDESEYQIDIDEKPKIERIETNKVPLSLRITSSVLSGIFTSIATTPLEVAKTRLQSQLDTSRNHHNKAKLYNGTLDAMYKITKYEGVGSLYRGLRVTIYQILPSSAMYFPLYEEIKHLLDNNKPQWKTNLNPLISGTLSRTIVATTLSPIEYLRTNIQSRRAGGPITDNFLELSRCIVKTQGIRGLWSGLSSTLYRDVTFSAIYWTGMEAMRSYLQNRYDATQHNILINFASGYVSGSLSSLITHPFDIVKTQYQMKIHKNKKSIIDYFRLIYVNEGLKGFTAGLVPRLIRVGPACGIMIAAYELLKSFV